MKDITAERIKRRRKELGLTLEKIASSLNVSKATVQRYETNKIAKMPVETIAQLSKVLNCSISYLMGWCDDPASGDLLEYDIKSEDEEYLMENFNKLQPEAKKTIISLVKQFLEK